MIRTEIRRVDLLLALGLDGLGAVRGGLGGGRSEAHILLWSRRIIVLLGRGVQADGALWADIKLRFNSRRAILMALLCCGSPIMGLHFS